MSDSRNQQTNSNNQFTYEDDDFDAVKENDENNSMMPSQRIELQKSLTKSMKRDDGSAQQRAFSRDRGQDRNYGENNYEPFQFQDQIEKIAYINTQVEAQQSKLKRGDKFLNQMQFKEAKLSFVEGSKVIMDLIKLTADDANMQVYLKTQMQYSLNKAEVCASHLNQFQRSGSQGVGVFKRQTTMSKKGDEGVISGDYSKRTNDFDTSQNNNKSVFLPPIQNYSRQNSERPKIEKQKTGGGAITRTRTLLAQNIKGKMTENEEDEHAKDSGDDLKKIGDENQDEIFDEDDLVEFETGDGTNHENNMEKFMKEYGATLPIQSQYVIDSKIYPVDITKCIQIIKYCVPEDFSEKTNTHASETIEDDQEIYGNPCYDKQNNCLRLVDFSNNYLEVVWEIPIPKGSKIKMSFSPDGNNFVLFFKKLNILQIYEIYENNLIDLIQRIDQGDQPTREYSTFNGGQFMLDSRKLKWSPKSEYLILFGFEKLTVIDFTDLHGTKYDIIEKFNIFQKSDDGRDTLKKQYRAILDVQISTQHLSELEYQEKGYRCDVALLQEVENQIVIRRIEDPNDNMKRVIPFRSDNILGIQIAISNDFSQVVYTNGQENLILKREIQDGDEDDELNADYSLGSLSWLNKKIVYHIMPIGASYFLFISSKMYDRDLDIYCSWTKSFKMQIKRKIEPEAIQVYDAFMSVDQWEDEHGLGSQLNILSYRDDELFYDILLPKVHQEKIQSMDELNQEGFKKFKFSQRDEIKLEISQEETEGFCCAWPYVTFKGIKHFQYIFNINFTDQIERVQLPKECIGIPFSRITRTLDLFILGEFPDRYVLWMIDLEKSHRKKSYYLKEIFSYSKESIGDTPILDFNVRPSSDKEDISLNKKLCLMVIHKHPTEDTNKLYFWCNITKMTELEEISDTKNTNLDIIDEDNYSFRQDIEDAQGNTRFTLQKMKIEFSDYVIQQIYEQRQSTDLVKSYAYDVNTNVLMIVTINMVKKRLGKSIAIIDLNENNSLYQGKLDNPELKGRLKTKLFIFMDGHIFYNNKCIKLRYDILKQENNSGDFAEYQVFDFYDHLLQLQIGEQIQKRMPIASVLSHRMVYLIKNRKKLVTKKILILPNLHERKIYLFNTKPNMDYFYTIYNQFIDQNDEQDEPIRIPYLVSMNLTQSVAEVYNMKGILTKTLDFKHIKTEFGNPKAVSNNGQNFIFQKSKSLTLNIVILTLHGLYKIKDIEVYEDIKKFIDVKIDGGVNVEEFETLKSQIEVNGEFQHLLDPNNCQIKYKINDQMDVVIQVLPSKKKQIKANLNNKKKFKRKILQNNANLNGAITGQALTILQKISIVGLQQLQKAQNNLIYFQKGTYGIVREKLDDKYKKILDNASRSSVTGQSQAGKSNNGSRSRSKRKSFFMSDQREECQQSIFQTRDHKQFIQGLDGMAINNSHVYFWNNFNIWYFDTFTDEHEFHRLGLKVDKDDKNTYIKTVRTGSNIDKIVVLVRQSAHSDSSIIWSVENDGEIEQFDNKINPKILWDSQGEAYITEEDKVYFSEMGVVMKAFDVQDINNQENTMKKSKQEAFGFHYGYKFDDLSHSFIFLREYISLSYCYMTFAINYKMQKLEDYENKDYLFDREMYNFLIDKKTFLHDKKLIKNSNYLLYILKNFVKIDQLLIEQIQYYYKQEDEEGKVQIVSPLHIAVEVQNNKSINILLLYMSQLDYSQFKTFKDLWPQLINFSQFPEFLREQTFFNMQMQNKQTLKVARPLSKQIVALETAQASYVDEFYFKTVMGEDLNNNSYNSYPVKIVGLEIGWLINDDWGKKFLASVLSSENLDLYEIDSIVILVEWLYSKYRNKALKRRIPAYIFGLIVFLVTIWAQESTYNRFKLRSDEQISLLRIADQKSILAKEALPANKGKIFTPLDLKQLTAAAHLLVKQDNILIACAAAGLLSTCWQIYLMRNQIINNSKSYWKSQWSYIDIIYVALNTIMCIMLIPTDLNLKWIRQFQAILSIIITLKMLYFFALYDKMSHLIQIMFKVFKDIVPFLIITLIVMFSFANSFWMIGQNQMMFDKIEVGNEPRYTTFGGSLAYIRLVTLGEFEVDSYVVGSASQKPWLMILFVFASFVLIIVLISMLVAIMGDTFNYNREIKNLVLMKSKLKFVIDNFWIANALGNEEEKKKCTYLITAMFNEEDDEDVEILKDVQEEVHTIDRERKQQTDLIMTELKKIKNKLKVIENDK